MENEGTEKGKETPRKRAALRKELREKTVGYMVAALGLVAGLAWNDAISALIKELFPLDQGSLVAKFVYAAVITVAIVLGSMQLVRIGSSDKN